MSEHNHEHTVSSPEITFGHPPAEGTGRIWKIFWLLSAVTVVELDIGFWYCQTLVW